ncbi:MAG: hypothetical protein HY336_00585 [Candidatus Doudnabacteria bacterium]|nr:hypothetical protein [Candidatus Doudnabacteria bacterium]
MSIRKTIVIVCISCVSFAGLSLLATFEGSRLFLVWRLSNLTWYRVTRPPVNFCGCTRLSFGLDKGYMLAGIMVDLIDGERLVTYPGQPDWVYWSRRVLVWRDWIEPRQRAPAKAI